MNEKLINKTCTVDKSAHCKCFDVLTDDQRELIEKKQVEVFYKKGEVIAKFGSFATHIIQLCEGLAKVYLEDNNETLILKIIGPGSLIGLSALSDEGDTFRFTISAYEDSVAKLIDINTMKYLIRENGVFASRIINIMSENANQINNRFFFMVHRQSYGRLADLLLCLSGNIFKSPKFDLGLTRKELAELAGMSTENVVRVLKSFQKDGLIEIQGKSFIISNPEGLRRICTLG